MPECPCENFGNGDGSASGEQITVNGVGETEGVSDGASAEQLKNRDDAQTVEEIAETGNSIREKESDVGKEVVYGRASGEQIPNRHDDDQSVETSQMGNGLGETEAVSDGALREPIKNCDDNKSVYEIAETGNNIGEKESDVGKEVVYGGASGEQIPNPNDDDQSLDESSQMGNGLGETEAVSDGALREPIKNCDDNKSVYEIAETENNIGEKESDVGKELVYGGASGEQIPNPNDYVQSVDETSQMGNGLCKTEAVSDDALAEPMKDRDNKSVDEAAETGNSIRENESDVGKEVVFGGASGEQIPNLHDDDQSVHDTTQMGNGLEETEGVSDGALAEPMKNCDHNKNVYEIAKTGNSIGEKESDVGKKVVYDGASGEQIPNPHDYDQSVDETSQMGNVICETEAVSDGALAEPMKNCDNKSVDEAAEPGNNSDPEKESDSVKQVIISGGASAEQITNPHDDDQSVETSQMGNGVLETERVSDRAPAEPIQNCNDKNSLDERAKKGNNSGAEKESDAVKQGQHITHSDHDKSPDEREEMANGVCEKTVELEGDLVKQGMTYDGESGEQTKNRDDHENIDESKANLDAKSEMTDRENLFSDIDSDLENPTDGDTDLTDIINTLADEIIETLAEETVSKYYGIEENEKKRRTD